METVPYTVELHANIDGLLLGYATRMGLWPEEAIRVIVGTALAGGIEDISVQPAVDDAELARCVSMMRLLAAVQGQLSCEECTQRLHVKDVKAGVCPHCKACLDDA